MSDVGATEMPETPAVADRPWSTATVSALGAAIAFPVLVLVAVVLGATGLVGWVWAVLIGLVLAVGVAAYLIVGRLSAAAEVVVSTLPPDARRYDRIDNLVDGLRLTAGVRQPAIHIIDDPAANAMAVSRNLEHTLVLTTGLVDRLELVAMEGVVAELMVRLRSGEAERDTLAVALGKIPLLNVAGLSTLTGAVASWADRFDDRQVDEANDDIVNDFRAAMLTRYPPGLQAALEGIRDVGVRPSAAPELDSLWFVAPDAADEHGRSNRPSLDLRIDALAEL